jgi:hypothetical protein
MPGRYWTDSVPRPIWILLAAALALPPAADARAQAKPQLRSAIGKVTFSQSRCPAGTQPGSPDCAKLALTERFASGMSPRTLPAAGRGGFPAGLRIAGHGSGICESESPTTVVTGPDGSVQLLSGSALVNPGSFGATRIVSASNRRGTRFAWLEPLVPGIACSYFDEGRALALPAGAELPGGLVSPVLARRVVARSRFAVTIAGSKDWVDARPDGTQIATHATWRLRLQFGRRG